MSTLRELFVKLWTSDRYTRTYIFVEAWTSWWDKTRGERRSTATRDPRYLSTVLHRIHFEFIRQLVDRQYLALIHESKINQLVAPASSIINYSDDRNDNEWIRDVETVITYVLAFRKSDFCIFAGFNNSLFVRSIMLCVLKSLKDYLIRCCFQPLTFLDYYQLSLLLVAKLGEELW